MPIFSYGDFLVRLDINDKGNTNAALPTKISPKSIELTRTDVPGLRERERVNNQGIMDVSTVHVFTIQDNLLVRN